MGVMSIPCCENITLRQQTGPVFVRAGWHHFVTMTRSGDITTWVPKTPLIIDTAGVTTDYWETNLDKRNYLKYRSSADWWKLDMTYDINTKGVCGSCLELSKNLNLDTSTVSVFQDLTCCVNRSVEIPNDDDRVKNCTATYYDKNDACYAKCSYTNKRYDTDIDGNWQTANASGYMNPDGSTDGTGVSLDIIQSTWDPSQQTPGTTGPRWVNWETPAEKAPRGHPLETPNFGALFAKDVECGAYHNIVRLSDDSIMAWGLNSMGQCNVPESLLPSSLRPAGVAPHPKKRKIFSLHCGFSTSAVMFNDGTVLCWGDAEVADEVNTWEFIKVSPIKRMGEGQDSCIGTPSVGYPELLPGGMTGNPEDWVAEELYSNSTYNANTDWWGHWHDNKTPGFPHFDLGVATDYIYPVNWNQVTYQDNSDVGGDQWSYRYATKDGLESPCATRGKNIKDYAVAMLRTGQIVTTRKENAPIERQDDISKLCRDCSTDRGISLSDGKYMPSHATAAVIDSIEVSNGDLYNPIFTTIDCVQQAIDFTGGEKCNSIITCDAYKLWGFAGEINCSSGYFFNDIPEGVGCFSSSIRELGYNPNWASKTDRFKSAGHAVGKTKEEFNNPTWNTAEANYGWASLPSASLRYRGPCANCLPGCKSFVYLPNCLTVVGQRDPCDAECPSSGTGNKKGVPAGIGDSWKGNNGYFRYPEHLMGFGCVAGTNTTCWLGPAKMLSSSMTEMSLGEAATSDVSLNNIPKTIGTNYSQIPLSTTRGDPCAECAFSGSSIDHEFHLAKMTRGCRYHSERDGDGYTNPLIDGGVCLLRQLPTKFDNHAEMMPSKPWGPFQLSTNIGNLPHPPIMEGIALDRVLGSIPYATPYNGILGQIVEDDAGILKWDWRTQAIESGILNSKLGNNIQNLTNATYSKFIEYPSEFGYFSTFPTTALYPVAGAYTQYTDCVCWMDESQTGDSVYDPNGCRSGGAIDGSDQPACTGRMPLDCGMPGKRYNPTKVSTSRDFGTGFTLEEETLSLGILCSAINLTGDKFATAGTAKNGNSTINIWLTEKGNIPHKPYEAIPINSAQDICGIKFISNNELFIRFEDVSKSKFGILDINTKGFTLIDVPLYNESGSDYNIGRIGNAVKNVLSANQTAVSLKQPGSESFRFITTNNACNKALLFKYVDSSAFTGFTLEAAFSVIDIFKDSIFNITNIKQKENDSSGVTFPVISGLEISKDGNTIAVGEGTNIFSTVVWGITACAGITCLKDIGIGLTFALDENHYTELPSYEYVIQNIGDTRPKIIVGLSQTVIRFNESETSIGVYGRRIGPFIPKVGSEYSWQAKIWNLCYGSGISASCSTLTRTNKIAKFINGPDPSTGSIIPSTMPSSTIADFSSDLNHIATATRETDRNFETPDWNYRLNTSDIIYKNILSDKGKLLVNLYNEDVEWQRSTTSINFIPDTHNMIISFFRDGSFPGENKNISEAIVLDYTVGTKSGSYPLWKKKLCGFRGGMVGEKPPKTWTGEYDLGCFTGWEKTYYDGLSGFFPDVEIGKNVCNCDEGVGNDWYNRWMWNNPSLSYASGRTWAVHLRRSPWRRDRDNASVFRWKSGCEESPEWGSDQIDSMGHIQKAYSHVINNYDDVKIWISGWMHDPCPPWPLDTWDSKLDIDIALPPTVRISNYDVTVSDHIRPDGLTGENGDVVPMRVRNCAKYPSWVPVPPSSTTNKRLGYSYQGRWIKKGNTSQWAQGLYGLTGSVAYGFTGSVDAIVRSFGISAAYQSMCTDCETPWTEEKPMGDMHVSDSYRVYPV